MSLSKRSAGRPSSFSFSKTTQVRPHSTMPTPQIPPLPKPFQHFGVSLLFVIILPLVPVGLEAWIKPAITATTITLAASMYAVTIGTSSRSPLLLALGVVSGLAFGMLFGAALQSGTMPPYTVVAATITILAVAVVHCCERWDRHACKQERFLEF